MTSTLIAQIRMLVIRLVERTPLFAFKKRMITNIPILKMDSLDFHTILQTLGSTKLCHHHGHIFALLLRAHVALGRRSLQFLSKWSTIRV